MLNLFKWLSPKTSRKRVSSQTLMKVREEWKKINTLVNGGTPSQLKQAVINADRAFDSILKDIAIGETMGERLKNSREKFKSNSDYQSVWDAHKVRNNLVHESGYEPPHYMLTQTVKKFEKGLASLGINL